MEVRTTIKLKYINVESGATLLLVAGLLPLLALLIGFSVELNEFYLDRKHTQRVVDAASRIAARKLPFAAISEQAARDYLTTHLHHIPGQRIQVYADSGSINVDVTRPFSFLLTALQSTSREAVTVTYTSSSRAELNYRNLVIFVDNSAYLAPQLTLANDDAWGSAKNWKAAALFSKLQKKPELHGQPIASRILTQQCFNPSLSALKEAAVRLYDFESAGNVNQVGVLMGPGPVGGAVFQVKSIGPATPNSKGNFAYYRTAFAADEWCLAASERVQKRFGYTLPVMSAHISPPFSAPTRITGNNYSLPLSASGSLTVREIIWSKAAARGLQGANSEQAVTVNIGNVLRRAGAELLGAPALRSGALTSENLSNTAVLLLGDFPHQAGRRFPAQTVKDTIQDELKQLNTLAATAKRHLTFYFVIPKHFGNYGQTPFCVNPSDDSNVPYNCPAFIDDSKAFMRFIHKSPAIRRLSNVEVQFLRVPDRASLAVDFIAQFAQFDHAALHIR